MHLIQRLCLFPTSYVPIGTVWYLRVKQSRTQSNGTRLRVKWKTGFTLLELGPIGQVHVKHAAMQTCCLFGYSISSLHTFKRNVRTVKNSHDIQKNHSCDNQRYLLDQINRK